MIKLLLYSNYSFIWRIVYCIFTGCSKKWQFLWFFHEIWIWIKNFLKTSPLEVILCKESISRIPEAWKRFLGLNSWENVLFKGGNHFHQKIRFLTETKFLHVWLVIYRVKNCEESIPAIIFWPRFQKSGQIPKKSIF